MAYDICTHNTRRNNCLYNNKLLNFQKQRICSTLNAISLNLVIREEKQTIMFKTKTNVD